MGPGQIFEGQYQIIDEIGRGSYGIVYRVEEVNTHQIFALKLLLPWAENDATTRKRFEREGEYGLRLKHPTIVRVEKHGHTSEGKPYLLMEFVEGQPLSKILKFQDRFSVEKTTSIARQILSALAVAHAEGVIHRDLKPDNVVLCAEPSRKEFAVKIFDFGIAKLVDEDSDVASAGRLTMTGTTIGTVDYMSPEQVEGEKLTPASDFYSLGIVLYEMLTGRVPYFSNNSVQIMIMHSSAPVPTLPKSIAGTPLGRAITKSLQKRPKDRPASAEEFLALLDNVAPPKPQAAPEPAPAVSPKPQPQSKTRSNLQRTLARYWLPIVIGVLLLILLISQWL